MSNNTLSPLAQKLLDQTNRLGEDYLLPMAGTARRYAAKTLSTAKIASTLWPEKDKSDFNHIGSGMFLSTAADLLAAAGDFIEAAGIINTQTVNPLNEYDLEEESLNSVAGLKKLYTRAMELFLQSARTVPDADPDEDRSAYPEGANTAAQEEWDTSDHSDVEDAEQSLPKYNFYPNCGKDS